MNGIYKCLAITRTARRIGGHHNVALLRKNSWMPACTPLIIPRALGSSVNQIRERIFLLGLNLDGFTTQAWTGWSWYQISSTCEGESPSAAPPRLLDEMIITSSGATGSTTV